METETDVSLEETNAPATNPTSSSALMRGLGVASLVGLGLASLLLLFAPTAPSYELSIFFSYSLTAFVGFYLASGNAWWWVRWLLVGLNVLLVILANDASMMMEGIAYFDVLTMISAGFTYAGRMMISALRRESSPRQRFTIFGLMLVTAITAVCLVALNTVFIGQGKEPVVMITVVLIGLGFAMTAQCGPSWACTKRQALIIGAIALVLAFFMSLVLFQIFHYIDGSPPTFKDILLPIWMTIAFMWLILYPLWFGCYALGWNLIAPGWKLGPRYEARPVARQHEEDVDVLMQE